MFRVMICIFAVLASLGPASANWRTPLEQIGENDLLVCSSRAAALNMVTQWVEAEDIGAFAVSVGGLVSRGACGYVPASTTLVTGALAARQQLIMNPLPKTVRERGSERIALAIQVAKKDAGRLGIARNSAKPTTVWLILFHADESSGTEV